MKFRIETQWIGNANGQLVELHEFMRVNNVLEFEVVKHFPESPLYFKTFYGNFYLYPVQEPIGENNDNLQSTH